MTKKLFIFIFLYLLLINVCGCAVLFVGAGAAGTATWLSNKLYQDVNTPYDKTLNAAKLALESFKFEIVKETTRPGKAQIISKYSDGKTIWIDINKIFERHTRIEVRVGAVNPDRQAAAEILEKMQKYL